MTCAISPLTPNRQKGRDGELTDDERGKGDGTLLWHEPENSYAY
jgi:hypothetical protein